MDFTLLSKKLFPASSMLAQSTCGCGLNGRRVWVGDQQATPERASRRVLAHQLIRVVHDRLGLVVDRGRRLVAFQELGVQLLADALP